MPRDAWIVVVFLVLAVVYWIAADGIRISPLDAPVTAAGLPKSLGYALVGLSVLLILRSLALRRSVVGRPAAPAPAAGRAGEGGRGRAAWRGRACQHLELQVVAGA